MQIVQRISSALLLVPVLLVASLAAHAEALAIKADRRPLVVGSVEPLTMVLRELYGDQARVVTLLDANQNPHHPMLSPGQVLMLRQADLLVWLGPQADPAVATLVAQRQGPSLALAALPGVVVRGADVDEHGHSQPGGVDPHLWLNPDNMAALAIAIGARADGALAAGEPAAFLQRLKTVDQAIHKQLAKVADVPWLTYHQPWAYFQVHYDLANPVIVSRQLDVGTSSRHFVALAGEIKRRDVQCAIIEPEAHAGVMTRLCPDCRRQSLDPLGRDQAGSRYGPWLLSLASAFRHCLSGH